MADVLMAQIYAEAHQKVQTEKEARQPKRQAGKQASL